MRKVYVFQNSWSALWNFWAIYGFSFGSRW